MNHLLEAQRRVNRADGVDGAEWAQFNALLAIAHALIEIAKRLPPHAETWSECSKRLRKEDQDGI